MEFKKTARNQVKRVPDRGHYDRDTIHQILDAGYLCHVGFAVDSQPFVIPTLYGRCGDSIYLHGSSASRLARQLAAGTPACMTVTHVDALVLARSAFHHSINYRSAVLFGTATEVTGDEKLAGLLALSEQVLPGRWNEVREPLDQELKATKVLRLEVESASAKIRTGPPKDEPEDSQLPVWAGLVPLLTEFGQPVADPALRSGIPMSDSVKSLFPAE